jgi:hypothetical protein
LNRIGIIFIARESQMVICGQDIFLYNQLIDIRHLLGISLSGRRHGMPPPALGI